MFNLLYGFYLLTSIACDHSGVIVDDRSGDYVRHFPMDRQRRQLSHHTAFFSSSLTWLEIHWFFIRTHFTNSTDEHIAAGDETIVTKSGKMTFGLGRFFSSLYGKPVPGLSFFAISLINVNTRTSHPIHINQQTAPEKTAETTASQPKPEIKPAKKKPGRPKGSKEWWTPPLEWLVRIVELRSHAKATNQELYDAALYVARDYGNEMGVKCAVDDNNLLVILDPAGDRKKIVNLPTFSRVRRERVN